MWVDQKAIDACDYIEEKEPYLWGLLVNDPDIVPIKFAYLMLKFAKEYHKDKIDSLTCGQNTFEYISDEFGFTALESEMRFLLEAIKKDNPKN